MHGCRQISHSGPLFRCQLTCNRLQLWFSDGVHDVGGDHTANVTETQSALTVVVPAYTTVYGAAAFNFASQIVITGASVACNDLPKLSATFSSSATQSIPVDSSVLNLGTYTLYASMTGKPIVNGDYTVTITNGTDTVTPAPSGVGITAAKTSSPNSSLGLGAQGVVLNNTAGVASATYTVSVGSLVTAGKGTPTGSVLVYDYFVPITSTTFIRTPYSGDFPTLNGVIQWPSTTIPPLCCGDDSGCLSHLHSCGQRAPVGRRRHLRYACICLGDCLSVLQRQYRRYHSGHSLLHLPLQWRRRQ